MYFRQIVIAIIRLVIAMAITICSLTANASTITADIAFATPTERDDLSLRSIEIDSSFHGIKMLLFGVRYNAGEVVVVIRGPALSYMIRKKERRAGIWVNRDYQQVNNVSGFYAIAASKPLEKFDNIGLLKKLGIETQAVDIAAMDDRGGYKPEFLQALLISQTNHHLFKPQIGQVSFIGDSLFRTIIDFPDNIPRGVYTAEAYLFSEGKLVGLQATPLFVKKTGFDAILFDLAYKHSFLYGCIAVLFALAAGWIAGIVFKKI
jgi:uncharacterized protein (TIGR02186 family)